MAKDGEKKDYEMKICVAKVVVLSLPKITKVKIRELWQSLEKMMICSATRR